MRRHGDYWLGIGLTGLGALVLSPDALLFRFLGAELWAAAFWRLLLMGLAITAFLLVRRGRHLTDDIRLIGWAFWPATLCMAIGNLGFVYALSHTTVADTLAILATAPVFAAILAALLGDRPPLRTWLAAAAIAVGIWIIFDASFGVDALRGNLAAGAVAIFTAIYFTLGRARRNADLTPALAMSGFLSAAVAAAAAASLAPPSGDWPTLCLMGLIVLPISLTLITIGPRRLPAAEVGLLMLLETALGPLWVWLGIGETPSLATLLGGGLILGALVAHSLAVWRDQSQTGPAPPRTAVS